ncbi:MAG: FprA family A-type flavoprotein [Bilifractor sp.]
MIEITKDIRYIGVNDHEIDLFEGQYKVPNGMAYNSYLIMDEKIAVMDTVETHFGNEWISNMKKELGDRKPDYLVVQHMEPDHSANISLLLETFPDITLVANAKCFGMMDQFYNIPSSTERHVVKNRDTLSLGKHQLTFIFAPMVHWPEVMVTYDSTDKVLFSADAFGKFGANDVDEPWDDEARRYYIGIVGKYGAQSQKLLQAASGLDIQTICSLHGPVLKDNLGHYLDLYNKWTTYTPEEKGVLIAFTTVYGHTKTAAEMLEADLKARGEKNVVVMDLARCDMAEAVGNAFRFDRIVLATTTYNADIFPFMREFIEHLTARNFQKRTVGIIENGSWAPAAKRIISGLLEKSRDITYLGNSVTIKSAMNDEVKSQIAAMADELTK